MLAGVLFRLFLMIRLHPAKLSKVDLTVELSKASVPSHLACHGKLDISCGRSWVD